MRVPVYVALLHSPVTNRKGEVVTTSVTNMDLHDIARSCRTYGVDGYFVVTPVLEQQDLVRRILNHWVSEESKKDHPDRSNAFSILSVSSSFEDVVSSIEEKEGKKPEIVFTDARSFPNSISYRDYRELIESGNDEKPVLILLGTGWGIAETLFSKVDRILEPIYGRPDQDGETYNHLSVRAAAAAILDRLLGC